MIAVAEPHPLVSAVAIDDRSLAEEAGCRPVWVRYFAGGLRAVIREEHPVRGRYSVKALSGIAYPDALQPRSAGAYVVHARRGVESWRPC